VLEGQGQTPLSPSGPASLTAAGAFLKHVLQPGSLQDKSGPSVATEFGVLLPDSTDALSLLGLAGMGLITPETTRLFLIGLPALVAGTLLGWSLYGKLNEVAFRKVVLVLLLESGLAIVVTGR